MNNVNATTILIQRFLSLSNLTYRVIIFLLLNRFLLRVNIRSTSNTILVRPIIKVLLLLLATHVAFYLLLLLIDNLLLISVLFLALHLSYTTERRLCTALFRVRLRRQYGLTPINGLGLLTGQGA